MRAIIIGNGTINDYTTLKNTVTCDDFVICADGGYYHAQKCNIVPDLIIGDFDSSKIPDNDIEKCIYPKRKDFTDSEISVMYACENGYDEIIMFGMTGTRLDHTLNNMLLLFRCKNSCMIDDNNEIYPFTDKIEFVGKKGKTLSIIPINGDLCGLKTKGLDYPLNDETIHIGESRGNSNVIVDDVCEIKTKSGKGFVIISNGE